MFDRNCRSGRDHRCKACKGVANQKRSAVRHLYERIAGGRKAYFALPPEKRKQLQDTARRLYEAGQSVSLAASYESTHRNGFVYAITNPAWPEAVKIGRACDPEARLASYQTNSPHRDYQLEHTVYFHDCYSAERELHARLESRRLNGEWFRLTVDEAVDQINQLREIL